MKRVILLVEDDALIALAESRTIEKFGYRVITAKSGEMAIETVRNGTVIDLILMDIDLGRGMDGTEAARSILAERELPIVFLTSHTGKDMVERVRGITRYGYISKNSGDFVLQSSIEMAFDLFDAHEKINEANRTLAEAETFRRILLDAIPVPVFYKDSGAVYLGVNKAFTRFFGMEEADIVGKSVYDISPGDLAAIYHGKDAELLEKPGIQIYESRVRDAAGVMHDVIFHKAAFPDASGRTAGLVGAILDITDRKRSEIELSESRENFRQLYSMLRLMCDNVPDMIWAKDMRNRYLFANKSLCENLLHAADTDEPLGKADMFFAERERGMRPDDTSWHTFGEICRDTDTMTLEAGKPCQYDEYGNVRGEFLYLDVRKAPFKDGTGKVIGTVGSGRDMTARKEADDLAAHLLKEQDLLLKEVHHRIKNNMVNIESLLSLQANNSASTCVKSALEDACGRVRSMRVMYDRLYVSRDFRKVSSLAYFQDLFSGITDALPRMENVRYEMDLDDFPLDSDQLFPLGIIVNELATNAHKYAFPDGRIGTFRLSIKKGEEVHTLSLSDDGVGLPFQHSADTEKGFGIMLVHALAEQLGGAIRSETGPGTTFILTFPNHGKKAVP